MSKIDSSKSFYKYLNNEIIFDYEMEAYRVALNLISHSPEMDGLLDEIWAEISLRKLNKNQHVSGLRLALEALCADLLNAYSHHAEGWAYRSLRKKAFTGQRIGYRPFTGIFEALFDLGYLEKTKPVNRPTKVGWEMKAPRIRGTAKFLALSGRHGIAPGDRSHFRQADYLVEVSQPITLKASSVVERGDKISGALMEVDASHPMVIQHLLEMDEINAFLGRHRLVLAGDPTETSRCNGMLRRFNCGDMPDHGYKKGGRLYPADGDYQMLAGKPLKPGESRGERRNLLIDGESVAEIDLGACHPRILLAKLGKAIDESIDPYGFEEIPRLVVKMWFTKTMGHTCFHRGWKKEDVKRYAEANPGRDLSKDYPIKKVEAAVLARFPALAEWPSCPIRWGDLQFIESEIIKKTMLRLARDHGIPAYPVHDSIIVPASKVDIARQVLREAFKEAVGVYPALSMKGA